MQTTEPAIPVWPDRNQWSENRLFFTTLDSISKGCAKVQTKNPMTLGQSFDLKRLVGPSQFPTGELPAGLVCSYWFHDLSVNRFSLQSNMRDNNWNDNCCLVPLRHSRVKWLLFQSLCASQLFYLHVCRIGKSLG